MVAKPDLRRAVVALAAGALLAVRPFVALRALIAGGGMCGLAVDALVTTAALLAVRPLVTVGPFVTVRALVGAGRVRRAIALGVIVVGDRGG